MAHTARSNRKSYMGSTAPLDLTLSVIEILYSKATHFRHMFGTKVEWGYLKLPSTNRKSWMGSSATLAIRLLDLIFNALKRRSFLKFRAPVRRGVDLWSTLLLNTTGQPYVEVQLYWQVPGFSVTLKPKFNASHNRDPGASERSSLVACNSSEH